MESEKQEHNIVDDLKKTKKGEIDWWDWEKQVIENIEKDPDRAEALLAVDHPLLLHEEQLLDRLNVSLQKKYGRNSYLELDAEKTGKHVRSPRRN